MYLPGSMQSDLVAIKAVINTVHAVHKIDAYPRVTNNRTRLVCKVGGGVRGHHSSKSYAAFGEMIPESSHDDADSGT